MKISHFFCTVFLSLVLFTIESSIGLSLKHSSSQTGCGPLEPFLIVGQEGRKTPGSSSNNIRSQPRVNGELLGQIPPEGRFDVLDGPECGGGFTWWQVDYNGLIGWTAESYTASPNYWLELIWDDVVIRHGIDLNRTSTARFGTLGIGGGGGAVCLVYENSYRGRLSVGDDINPNDIMVWSAGKIDNPVAISPRGEEIILSTLSAYQIPAYLIIEERITDSSSPSVYYDPPSFGCIGYYDDEEASLYGLQPVDFVRASPRMFFNSGRWEIRGEINSDVVTTEVSISTSFSSGWERHPNGESRIYYHFDLNPREGVSVFYFDDAISVPANRIQQVRAQQNGYLALAITPYDYESLFILSERSQVLHGFVFVEINGTRYQPNSIPLRSLEILNNRLWD